MIDAEDLFGAAVSLFIFVWGVVMPEFCHLAEIVRNWVRSG